MYASGPSLRFFMIVSASNLLKLFLFALFSSFSLLFTLSHGPISGGGSSGSGVVNGGCCDGGGDDDDDDGHFGGGGVVMDNSGGGGMSASASLSRSFENVSLNSFVSLLLSSLRGDCVDIEIDNDGGGGMYASVSLS